MSKKNIQHKDITFPGPHIKGEPFWSIMDWNRNSKIKLLGYDGLDILFLNENSAKIFKNSIDLQNNMMVQGVIRGINKDFLKELTKEKNKIFLIPLCEVQSEKINMLKVSSDEIKYYAKHNKFKNDNLQKSIELYNQEIYRITKQHNHIIFDKIFENVSKLNKDCNYKFNNLDKLFREYREVLIRDTDNQNKELINRYNSINNNSQIFIYPFSVSGFGLEIGWDIDKVKNIIKNKNIQSTKISVDKIFDKESIKNIVEDYNTSSKEPIIVANIENIPTNYIVIDGNHRINKYYRNNIKEIDAYILNPEEHIEGMTLTVYKDIYKVVNNICNIQNYIVGKLEYDKLELYEIK